ncbi:hypothetical protein BB558_000803 [Smittium angustum]|uniref:Uncharacterized protein n=1 Tax=Smittium angustum TaxID=133377 RepID=A0A2U1JDF3_SMIAN|nr:hypothetical protein BB558_000803 [Smittium angustum]
MTPNTTILPYFQVQEDWKTVIDETLSQKHDSSSFWVSVYEKDKQSVHGTITVDPQNLKNNSILSGSDGIIPEYNCISKKFSLSHLQRGIPSVSILSPEISYKPASGSILSFDVNKDQMLYVVGHQSGKMAVYETLDNKVLNALDGHFGDINSVRFFPSGKVILSASLDMRLKIWSAEDGSNPVTLTGHTSSVTDCGIVGIGKNVVSCSKDGSVKLWNCGSASCINSWNPNMGSLSGIFLIPPTSFDSNAEAFSEINSLVTSTSTGNIALIDIREKNKVIIPVATMESQFSKDPLTAISGDDTGTFISSGNSQGIITLWDLRNSSEPLSHIQRDSFPITSMETISINGKSVLVTGSQNGSVFGTDIFYSVDRTANVIAEYTTSDLDPVYTIRSVKHHKMFNADIQDNNGSSKMCIYTSGRNGIINGYW